jgi:hypothetical protein
MQTVWSTSLIPQTQRAEFWRSAVCNAFLSMTPRIAHAADFEARLDHLSLERVALNRVVAPAHGVTRTPSDIRRDEKQVFFINLSPGGRCRVRQFGREHTALAGELILIDSNSPYSIDLPDDGELLSLSPCPTTGCASWRQAPTNRRRASCLSQPPATCCGAKCWSSHACPRLIPRKPV